MQEINENQNLKSLPYPVRQYFLQLKRLEVLQKEVQKELFEKQFWVGIDLKVFQTIWE